MVAPLTVSDLRMLAERNEELVDTLKEALDVDDEATVEIALSELELNATRLSEAVSRLAPVDAVVPGKPNATQPNE